jgi:hypothetical protein
MAAAAGNDAVNTLSVAMQIVLANIDLLQV